MIKFTLSLDAPVATATMTPVQASPQAVGGTLIFNAASTGGGATHEYQLMVYSYDGDTTWRAIDGFTTGTTLSWNTTGEVAGSYLVQLRVRCWFR